MHHDVPLCVKLPPAKNQQQISRDDWQQQATVKKLLASLQDLLTKREIHQYLVLILYSYNLKTTFNIAVKTVYDKEQFVYLPGADD